MSITTLGTLLFVLSVSLTTHAEGLYWPTNQLLPTFSTPAPSIDVINLTSVTDPERDLFTSLQGILNRTQPRVGCPTTDQENNFTWIDLHNLPYTTISGYTAITKYRTNFIGLVVTDSNVPDTLNLATTIAGISNVLVCDPSLLPTLTNSPYNLPIVNDLRGLFTDKLQVYGYLFTNYWPLCTHRIISGMSPGLHGNFRDYIVAVKSATVWLDPAISTEKTLLTRFFTNVPPMSAVYAGWWPSEANGLNWIYQFGVPVLASDFLQNGSLFSFAHEIKIPDIPPPPPLQNKVYVSMILSDGDNIQYMQHRMKYDWDRWDRSIPVGWTVTPLAVDIDPGMLNYFYSTATTNDCLISGPSGAGYTHMQKWSTENTAVFTRLTDPYLRRSGLRIITVWDSVNTSMACAFATNCPTLLGLTDQTEGSSSTVNLGLITKRLAAAYSSDTNAIYTRITNAAAGWNGTAPFFIAVQANVWDLGPWNLRDIANRLDTNKYVVVRPDHLFLLQKSVYGYPTALTKSPVPASPTAARLRGSVIPNSSGAMAWFEWGTNINYGSKSTVFTLGNTNSELSYPRGGFLPHVTYHYRVVASNALGLAYGADRIFTVGNRVKAWGDGSLGQTNIPPRLNNVVSISCGGSHALALLNTMTVVAWGDNSQGQTNVPQGLTGVVEVAGGGSHSLALRSNGGVIAWGDNTYGKTNVPAQLTNAIAIAAGGDHSLAIKADGTVVAWGDGTYGQTNVPIGLTNVVAIAAGYQHSLALRADGSVVAWGNNSSTQTNVPTNLENVVAISAGQNFSLALRANGNSAPAPVPATRWVADSLSGPDGTLVGNWIDLNKGARALQTASARQPRLYSNIMNGHKIVRFTGFNQQHLTVAHTNSPISGAGSFTIAMVLKTATGGTVSSSFYNNTALLGAEQSGIKTDWAFCLNGSQIGAGLGAGKAGADTAVYGGSVVDNKPHIAILHRAGDRVSLYVDGVLVASQSSLSSEARGKYNFLIGAMTTNGGFFTGDIAEIQLYDEALSSRDLLAINENLSATYGINTGMPGSVVLWGNSASNQLKPVPGLSNVVAAASGSGFNFALTDNDTLGAWGNNTKGQLNIIPGLTNITAIAAGTNFALAIGNQPPSVVDATFSGYVSHDLVLNIPYSNPDENPFLMYVLSLPENGSLYQYSNGARGSLISQTNTVLSDYFGRIVFAPNPGETGSPYTSFNVSARDAYYRSETAHQTISIITPALPQLRSLGWDVKNASTLKISFSGNSNATYSVWGSTNLVEWRPIGTAMETSPENYELSGLGLTNSPQDFYRISAP